MADACGVVLGSVIFCWLWDVGVGGGEVWDEWKQPGKQREKKHLGLKAKDGRLDAMLVK